MEIMAPRTPGACALQALAVFYNAAGMPSDA